MLHSFSNATADKAGVIRPSLAGLARPEAGDLRRMLAAGREIWNIHRLLAKTGDNVVGEVLRGNGTFFEWDHYPPGDVYDAETHAQYYYHAHPEDQRFPGEHGHFHTFLRPQGMPAHIKPLPVPNSPLTKVGNDAISHIVAISMDTKGFPICLFTVNRWVTGETWYAAPDVIEMLENFEIDHARPSWPANRWVSAMLVLFEQEVVELIKARDQAVEAWRRHHNPPDVFEDRDLEVTSLLDVSIEGKISELEAQLER